MMTTIVVAFLIAHGLVHLAVWLPHPDPAAGEPPPFRPDHSAVLTAVATPPTVVHRLSVRMAAATAAMYVAGAVAVAADLRWAAGVVAVAATLGLLLKALFFNPWLSLGVLLDLVVIASALYGWPMTLT